MSNIEWTDMTWNPVIGCKKVAAGCASCYAEKMSKRLAAMGQADYAQVLTPDGRFNGKAIPRPDTLAEPLHWRKPRRVFVNSMSDLFHEDVPFEFIAAVYGVMAACPQHTFQILTKRPERMLEFFEWVGKQDGHPPAVLWEFANDPKVIMRTMDAADADWPLPNVWHGVSVAEQKDADRNIPILLKVPSAIRFISAEPLIGPVTLATPMENWLDGWTTVEGTETGSDDDGNPYSYPVPEQQQTERLDWVIVGGESGPGARPCDVAWIRSIVDQCKAAGVACFVKQLGAKPAQFMPYPGRLALNDRKGGDPSEWPADLRVREWPDVAATS